MKIKFNKIKLKEIIKSKQKKKGALATEMILIIGIILVVLVTIFYPTFSSMINLVMSNMSIWFNNSLINMGLT